MVKYFYARVSSSEQKEMGISIQAQLTIAKEKGILDKNIFIDAGKSGSIDDDRLDFYFRKKGIVSIDFNFLNRSKFAELWFLLKEGDEVYFTFWDRISRSSMVQNLFVRYCNKLNVSLHPILDNFSDPFIRDIMSAVNEKIAKTISDKTRATREMQFKMGLHGFRAPTGYIKNIKDKKTGKLPFPSELEGSLIIDKNSFKLVEEIFNLALTNSIKEICDIKGLHSQVVSNILRNDIYAGWIHFEEQVCKGKHEPIVSQELFDKVQELLR